MSETPQKRWPGETDEAHPEIFNTIPPQPSVLKPGQLSREQVEQFFDQGFLVIDSFFKNEELDPAKDAINDLVEELAVKLHKAGKIKDLYHNYGYLQRLTMMERDFPGSIILLHKLGKLPQALRNIWSNERMLNVVEQMLGTPNIAGHPAWNLRTKVPNAEEAAVPWHQDNGYFDRDSYTTFQVIAWIPLIDADISTGCMQMARYGHKSGRVARHVGCYRDTWHMMLEEDEMRKTLGCDLEKDVVTCPVPYGGLILFNNLTPHRSIDNISEKVRWSLDFRWQEASKPDGYFGLKKVIQMRSSTDPHFKIDWETFDSVDRHHKHFEHYEAQEEDFDTTIPGPWMKQWELVHTNRHTRALENNSKAVVVS